jgi:hypothetical protein
MHGTTVNIFKADQIIVFLTTRKVYLTEYLLPFLVAFILIPSPEFAEENYMLLRKSIQIQSIYTRFHFTDCLTSPPLLYVLLQLLSYTTNFET